MTDLQFKRLKVENWQEPDPTLSIFRRLSLRDGSTQTISGDDWAGRILIVELNERAPLEVRRLFAVARGALVYGFFFYPLYTLGAEQLFRVADVAVGYKCQELGMSSTKAHRLHFEERVAHLVKEGIITPSARHGWDALRQLRNVATHPRDQHIFSSGDAIGQLRRIAADIDKLFSN